MFCKKCGSKLSDESKFCQNCGESVSGEVSVQSNVQASDISSKKKLVAFLTALLAGTFGVHDFYLGNIGRGVFKAIFSSIGYFFYFIIVALTGNLDNIDSEGIIIAFLFICLLEIVFLFIPAIIALVDWINILRNRMKDKNGLRVVNWT